MEESFIRFLESPTKENYLVVREQILRSDSYQPMSDELILSDSFVEKEQFANARDVLEDAMRNLLLSPRAHWMLGFIATKSEKDEIAKIESHIGCTCCDGILSTGDGTRSNPYLVLRVSDELDVIEYLSKNVISQSMACVEGRDLDHIECDDGSDYWFDVSDAIKHREKQLVH